MTTVLSVGLVSPFPPVRSGVADYSAELLAELSRFCKVTPFPPEDAARAFTSGLDVALLQIGNDPLHAPSVEALEARGPGTKAVVVLHDFVLHHLFAAAYLDRGREGEYVRQMERAHGERGRELAVRSVSGPRVPIWDLDPWSFPLSAGVLGDADAVIVHSRLVRGAALRERPNLPVIEIPHHVVPAPRAPRVEARRRFGIPEGRPLAVTLGLVTPAKRVGKLLEAMARLGPSDRPFLLVGGAVGDEDPLRLATRELALDGDVAFTGYLSEADFWLAASAADLSANLRHPTMGETSGAVCRLAGLGLPMVVSEAGWFRELPDSFATKVPVGREEVSRLAEALALPARDPALLARRGEAARSWGADRHPARVAQAYERALRWVVEGWSGPLALVARAAGELASMGVGRPGAYGCAAREPDAHLVAAVSRRAAGVLPVGEPAFR